MTPITRRILALSLGLSVALGVGEVVERALHPTLPSVEALSNAAYRVASVAHPGDPERACVALEQAPGSTPSLRRNNAELLVGGDSVAAGYGVSEPERFDQVMARALAPALGHDLAVENVAMPAAGWCMTAARLGAAIPELRPKLVLVVLFADDLQAHEVVLIDGKMAAPTEIVDNPLLRQLVRRSYLANALWFEGLRAFGRTPSVNPSPEGVVQFRNAMIGLDQKAREVGGQALFTLVPPAGLPRCARGEAATDVCANVHGELDLIAFHLDKAGVRWVDLRGIWDAEPRVIQEHESGTPMPVHPDAAGHARLAEALLPAVRAGLGL